MAVFQAGVWLVGVLLAARVRVLTTIEQVLVGFPLGFVLTTYVLYGAALRWGLTAPVVWVGVGGLGLLAAGLGGPCLRIRLSSVRVADLAAGLRGCARRPAAWGALALAVSVLTLHALAVVTGSDGWIAHGSTYTDLIFHMAVTSVLAGTPLPPQHPYCAGSPLHYHFMADFFSAALVTLGAPVENACRVPDALFSLTLGGLLLCLARRSLATWSSAVCAVALAMLGGGIGLATFIRQTPMQSAADFWRSFLTCRRPFDMWPPQGLYWSNLVRDFLLHARPVGPALCLALAAFLILLADAQRETGAERKPDAPPDNCTNNLSRAPSRPPVGNVVLAGALLGSLYLVNVHVCVGSALIASGFVATRRLRRALGFLVAITTCGLVCYLLAPAGVPQGFGLAHGWMNCGPGWPGFWARNVGVIFLLAPLGAVFVRREARPLVLASWLAFLAGNLWTLSSGWANQKVMLPWFLMAAIATAAVLERLWQSRWAGRGAAGLLFLAATATGVLCLCYNVGHCWLMFDASRLQVGAFCRQTDPRAVFLTDESCVTVPTILGGRPVYYGVEDTLEAHGVDSTDRQSRAARILAGTSDAADLLAREQIDYVIVRLPGWEAAFRALAPRCPIAFHAGGLSVFDARAGLWPNQPRRIMKDFRSEAP